MTAPERIWAFYSEIFGPMWIDKVDEGGTEYIRADLHDATAQEDQTDEALPADIEKMAYTAGYIDGNCGCTHKFSGQIGVAIGDEYGLAIEPQPDPPRRGDCAAGGGVAEYA